MANMNVAWDALKKCADGVWGSRWVDRPSEDFFDFTTDKNFYARRFPVGTIKATAVNTSIDVSTDYDASSSGNVIINLELYAEDPSQGASPISISSKTVTLTGTTAKKVDFNFSSLDTITTGNLYVVYKYGGHPGSIFDSGAWIQADLPIAVTYTDIPALTPSIVQPSGTKSGADQILFSWDNSGAGTQTKAELQWSTDGATWQSLTTVGTDQTYTAAAKKFPAGTIYWRVQVTSSYGIVSNWVRGSFTVRYAGATVTLTAPTSGSRDGAEAIPFGWSINAGDGSIQRTVMEVSTDDGLTWQTLVDRSARVTSYTADPGQFPAGALRWRVTAYNEYQDASAVTPVQASFTVTYSAVSQVIPVNSPTSGIIGAGSSRTFAVALQASGVVHTPFTISDATFYWRSGESGDFTAVAMTPDGNTASVTIPAGTFPSGVIQWYAEATDNTGRTTSTGTYTLQALNATVEAAPIAPISTLESGSGPIVFRWTYGSIDGAPQDKAQIRYSTDGGASWDMLPDIPGSDTVTTVPAGTFPGGTVTWQVRAYNEAGTEGPWSSSVSFISFAAPLVDGVTGDGKPFLTISWQTEGQRAYEIEVDGKTYGPYSGEDVRSYTLPEPLAAGSHLVRVRAQNRYSLWSEWAEGNVSVRNVPGTVVSLSADDGVSVLVSMLGSQPAPVITDQPQDITTVSAARLRVGFVPPGVLTVLKAQWFRQAPGSTTWTATSKEQTISTNAPGLVLNLSAEQVQEYSGYKFRVRLRTDTGTIFSREMLLTYGSSESKSPLITGYFPAPTGYFLIYRDGELIAKTYEIRFVDRTALGTHEYSVIQVLPNGYYTRSNPAKVTATASVKCPMIGRLDGGEFIELKLSDSSRRTQNFARRRQVAYTQYAGAKYPAAEIGEHETLTGSFDVAYPQKDAAAADAFEALLSEAVILKTPGGKVVVGILEGWDLGDMRFYKSYRCTLQQMDWGEFIDDSIRI